MKDFGRAITTDNIPGDINQPETPFIFEIFHDKNDDEFKALFSDGTIKLISSTPLPSTNIIFETINNDFIIPTSYLSNNVILIIKDITGNAENVNLNITTENLETIDGKLSVQLISNWSVLKLFSNNGINWYTF